MGGRGQMQGESDGPSSLRIDKWLWFARVVRTRTLASGLVTDGKVRVNRARIEKPGMAVKVGDVVTVTAHARVRVLRILALADRRGSPMVAQALYEELTPARAVPSSRFGDADPPSPAPRDPGAGRPTKRDRRDIDRLKR